MNLALIIPVWNDQTALERLLDQAQGMEIFDEIVVVDDGSDSPVHCANREPSSITLLRHDRPKGPGAARNAGLSAVTASHLLFFDSDDELTAELPRLWRDLQGRDFDICLFRHCDSRQAQAGLWRQMPLDDALWQAAGMGGQALAAITDQATAHLAQTANYPWNRISRTDFLRRADIRFSEIMMHEDIQPHWQGFLRAERILASDRVAAIHHMAHQGGRLTNRRTRERLDVFGPLTEVLRLLETAPASRAALLPAYLRFVSGLLDWIRANLEPAFHRDLAERTREFLLRAFPPARFDRLAATDPVLALHLTLQMAGERTPC